MAQGPKGVKDAASSGPSAVPREVTVKTKVALRRDGEDVPLVRTYDLRDNLTDGSKQHLARISVFKWQS